VDVKLVLIRTLYMDVKSLITRHMSLWGFSSFWFIW